MRHNERPKFAPRLSLSINDRHIVRASLEAMRPNAQPIGPYDVLLAGHALALGAVFVTHNTREFSRVSGLSTEDWQSRGQAR